MTAAPAPSYKYLFVGGPADCRGIVVPQDVQEWELKLLPNFHGIEQGVPLDPDKLQPIKYHRHRIQIDDELHAEFFAVAGMTKAEAILELLYNYKWRKHE